MTLPRAPMHSFGFLEEPWMASAPCRGLGDLFFIDDGKNERYARRREQELYAEARKICASCPFTGPCLEYALASHAEFGLYGGFSPWERHDLQRQRSRWRREMSA